MTTDRQRGPSHSRQPYGADGKPALIDRDRVREIAARNVTGQADLLAQVQTMKI